MRLALLTIPVMFACGSSAGVAPAAPEARASEEAEPEGMPEEAAPSDRRVIVDQPNYFGSEVEGTSGIVEFFSGCMDSVEHSNAEVTVDLAVGYCMCGGDAWRGALRSAPSGEEVGPTHEELAACGDWAASTDVIEGTGTPFSSEAHFDTAAIVLLHRGCLGRMELDQSPPFREYYCRCWTDALRKNAPQVVVRTAQRELCRQASAHWERTDEHLPDPE